jgi:Tfp pilus assembly protein PilO
MSRLTLRNLIISSVFLLVALGVFVYGLYTIEAANSRLTEQITALETNRAQEVMFQQMQRIADESEDNRMVLDAAFLAGEGESIDFLNTVETLARDVGLSFTTENLRKATDEDTGVEKLVVGFSYTGDYQTVTDFLATLENLSYIGAVTSFELSQGLLGDWSMETTMEVNLYDYEN